MKYLSLFSGIGGFELGIQQAYEKTHSKIESRSSTDSAGESSQYDGRSFRGAEDNRPNLRDGTERVRGNSTNIAEQSDRPTCIGYSEIDKYAIQIYGKHFDHPNFGSIRDIVAEELPDFGLLCGGFPCQSFSIAGKRGGFEDTRGTLFFDIARIAKVKRPRLLFLENVKGLLSHDDGRTFNTIINTLDELGYDVQWQVLNSKNFGVPQNRERIFIIGHLRGTPRPQVFPFREADENGISRQSEELREQNSGTLRTNYAYAYSNNTYIDEGRNAEPNTPTIGMTIPANTKQGYEVAEEGDSINLAVPSSTTRCGRVGKGVAQTLDTGMQQHTIQDMKIRRLTPVECERLQGFPDGWTEGISDSQRYKCLGNAVTVNVIEAIAEKLL